MESWELCVCSVHKAGCLRGPSLMPLDIPGELLRPCPTGRSKKPRCQRRMALASFLSSELFWKVPPTLRLSLPTQLILFGSTVIDRPRTVSPKWPRWCWDQPSYHLSSYHSEKSSQFFYTVGWNLNHRSVDQAFTRMGLCSLTSCDRHTRVSSFNDILSSIFLQSKVVILLFHFHLW